MSGDAAGLPGGLVTWPPPEPALADRPASHVGGRGAAARSGVLAVPQPPPELRRVPSLTYCERCLRDPRHLYPARSWSDDLALPSDSPVVAPVPLGHMPWSGAGRPPRRRSPRRTATQRGLRSGATAGGRSAAALTPAFSHPMASAQIPPGGLGGGPSSMNAPEPGTV